MDHVSECLVNFTDNALRNFNKRDIKTRASNKDEKAVSARSSAKLPSVQILNL